MHCTLVNSLALCAISFLAGNQNAPIHQDGFAGLPANVRANATHPLAGNINGHSVHAKTDGNAKVTSVHAMINGRQINHTRVVKTKPGVMYHTPNQIGELTTNTEVKFIGCTDEVDECQCNPVYIGFVIAFGGNTYIFWFPSSAVGNIVNIVVFP